MGFDPIILGPRAREQVAPIPTKPARKPRGQGRVGKRKAEACAAARQRFGVDAVSVYVPLRTESETNARGRWFITDKRRREQQEVIGAYLLPVSRFIRLSGPPYVVTLTRFGKGTMDPGNYEASFKHVQDEVARCLEVDDGDAARVRWVYGPQVKAKFYAVRIHIAVAAVTVEGGGASATAYHPTRLHNRASQVGEIPKRQAGSAEGGGNP
jgi:hypothetical protein